MPTGAETRERLTTFLRARIPFISVRSSERARVIDMLTSIARERQLDVVAHTLSQGLRELRNGAMLSDDKSLYGALEFTGQQFLARQNLTVVLTDVPQLADDNDTTRRLVDLAALGDERGGSVIVLTSEPVWTPLARMGMAITLDPPDQDEMHAEIQEFLRAYSGSVRIDWTPADFEAAASILAGVTRIEALNILATLVVRPEITHRELAELSRAKDSIFSDLVGIERVPLKPDSYTVGGLAGLRRWLDDRRPMLTMDLRDRDLRPPRGVLLVGVPGCGKSLSAKAVASRWELPLYRLDLASILGMYVGQSEGRLREALATADTVAPCVLWIDEIEKGLAGAGTDSTGITTRLVGQFLYWLQESPARVFVVATANDVRALPQELLRRGRFDAMFFVDLPGEEERNEIIGIYLRKHLRVETPPDLVDDLVQLSAGFAGSDIQSAIAEIAQEAIRLGDDGAVPEEFYRDKFRSVVPMSRSAPEQIREIRAFAERAMHASGTPSYPVSEGIRHRTVIGDR
jgi:hypothetical protein